MGARWVFKLSLCSNVVSTMAIPKRQYRAGSDPKKDFTGRIRCSNRFHDQGLNPDHCFVATANESGVQDDREKEMEENMNEVSAIINNLRNVANDMGNTINAQNQMLERIDKKQNSDIQRVGMAVQKAGELMS